MYSQQFPSSPSIYSLHHARGLAAAEAADINRQTARYLLEELGSAVIAWVAAAAVAA